MTDHPPWWDPYSSQPYKLAQAGKSKITTGHFIEYLKILITTVGLLPAVAYKFLALKPQMPKNRVDFAGLSINAEPQWQSAHVDMVNELGVKHLLLRVPGWQLDKLDEVIKFIEKFPDQEFLINILQSARSVEYPDQWRNQLETVFAALSGHCTTFQIANAVNRTKWGCKHSGQALELFKIADEVRSNYPEIKLLGSSIIDFEPLLSLRTLFNFSGYKNDGCASLLYINRRGSAYGKQYRYFRS